MNRFSRVRPTPALIVSMVALVAAMSGAAVALPGKSTVNSGDIKDGGVKSADIKPDAVGSKHVKGKSIQGSDVQDDALKGKQIFEDKLEIVPEAKSAETVKTVTLFGDNFERVTATDGVDTPTALAAAPKVALASKGQLSVYGKCLRNTTSDTVFARVYIETSANGAVFEGGSDQLEGTGGFLDVATPENDRELLATSTGTNGSIFDTGSWYALAPDGKALGGQVAAAAKNGTVPGGNGLFGDGNVCLFAGDAIG